MQTTIKRNGNRSQNQITNSKAETNSFRERIEARAHEIYLARGAEPGHELEDWLQAENELMERGWV